MSKFVAGTTFDDTPVVIELLGELHASVNGTPVTISAEKERLLIATLGLAGESGVPVDALLDGLWATETGNKGSLQTYVSNLRRTLKPADSEGAPVIELANDSYRLNPKLVATDVAQFRHHLAETRSRLATGDQRDDAFESVTAALAIAPSPLDTSLVDATSSLVVAANQIREEWLEAKWIWADLELRRDNAPVVIPDLLRVIDEHPNEERFWRLLMLAYWHTGRQDDALRAYQSLREWLGEELGLLPAPSLQDLEQAILRHDPMLDQSTSSTPNVPRRSRIPITRNSFIGRENEVGRVEKLLDEHHLLTLKGAGGCGKTRLAREIAVRRDGGFPGGVYLVELGELDAEAEGESAIIDAIATAVGMIRRSQASLEDTLVTELGALATLLVLDNCEKMIDPIAEVVTRLTEQCPELKVLATSRESLRVVGEVIVEVDPLQVAIARPALVPSDSARLFLDRADPTSERIRDDSATLTIIESICTCLDGVPLAIELAAALASTIPLQEILAELREDRFELLSVEMRGTAQHHRTLESVVRWSYDVLSEDERRLFDAVSMCPGTFTLDTAAALSELTSARARRLLEGLVRQSMVETVSSERGVERYRLLETMRVFGQHRLEERGHESDLESRFIQHFVSMAKRESYDPTTRITDWFEDLMPDIPNLRMAIRRAMDTGRADDALALIDSFHWYYNHVASLTQTEHWLRSLVPEFGPEVDPPDLEATLANSRLAAESLVVAFTALASLANLRGAYSETSHWADLSVAAARDHGSESQQLAALVIRGATAVYENRMDIAFASFEESIEIAGAIGSRWGNAVALTFLALGERREVDKLRRSDPTSDWMNRLGNVGARFERAYELFDQLRDDRGMALVLINLGRIEQHKGDLKAATVLVDRGLQRALNFGDDVVTGLAHVFRGRIACEDGDYELGAECFITTLEYCDTPDRHRVLFSTSAEWLGVIASHHGDSEPLLRIAAATESIRNAPRTAAALPELHDETDRVRFIVGPKRAAELEADGRTMEPDAVRLLAIRAARAALA